MDDVVEVQLHLFGMKYRSADESQWKVIIMLLRKWCCYVIMKIL